MPDQIERALRSLETSSRPGRVSSSATDTITATPRGTESLQTPPLEGSGFELLVP